MHAFDPLELDVARSARPTDEPQRASRVKPIQRLGHARDDLLGKDDDNMVVGHECQYSPTLVGCGVEHDRAGGGNGNPTTRANRVGGIEL